MDFTIDISEPIARLQSLGRNIEGIGDEIAERIVTQVAIKWRDLASQGLHKTRETYEKAIGEPVREAEGVWSVSLIGTLPNMIEQGAPAFDMKRGFAASPKRTPKKKGNGWYLTVPFRWATAAAVAESSVFSNQMRASIENQIKAATPRETTYQGGRYEIRKAPRSAVNNALGVRVKIVDNSTGQTFEPYIHKTPLEMGLHRRKSLSESSQTGYFTYRRVSDKSDANSWIHKGFIARQFLDKAVAAVEPDFAQISDGILKNLF